MTLLPGWQTRLQQAPSEATTASEHTLELPKATRFYAQQTQWIDSVEKARAFVAFAQQRPVAWIGIDTEFRFDRPEVVFKAHQRYQDPTSVRPLLLSVTLAEPDGSNGRLYTAVFDLRRPIVVAQLPELLRLPVPFVAHHLKAELFCLWPLGLPTPRSVWDTMIAEATVQLGLNHKRYRLKPKADAVDETQAKEAVEEQQRFSLSLLATCQRYGVPHGFDDSKSRLQQSFLDHPDEAPFSVEQIDYAAADAIAAARLYPLQVQRVTQAGVLQHLIQIEMPWTVTNAHMEWTGFRVGEPQRDQALSLAGTVATELRQHLAGMGLANPNSHPQLMTFFRQQGVLSHFRKGKGYSFDKEQLRTHQDAHPAVRLLRDLRKAEDILSEKLLNSALVGSDGRLHPVHRQLGTDTGRQTSTLPNVLGLPRYLRSVIVPELGYGLGEADWSQVEVGIAAAVYQDAHLIALFNSGDVYSGMAQRFFADTLTAQQQGLPSSAFKRQFPELRARMKTCTLGILYGLTAQGLAQQLGTSKQAAQTLLNQFLALFPALQQAQQAARVYGAIRGYASTMTGLRRYRGRTGTPTQWERNWLVNHPVQGSAAVVFKAAGNRLDHLYPAYNARLIIPLHDAFVFEAPIEHLTAVANLTERVMCEALQEQFPELQPRVDVNIQQPACWNKDGDTTGLQRWVQECAQVLEQSHLDAAALRAAPGESSDNGCD